MTKEIRNALKDIHSLKVEVAYPFLLEVFEDYEQNRFSREEFLSILRMVESYVFRRVICGIPTNSLNKTFANLSKEIDKNNYLESLTAAFLLKDSYRRFPSDEEFRQGFMIKDVYNFRNRNYLLRKLENDGRKELVIVDEYTIEHIMPQSENLSKIWKQELGNDWQIIWERYLHTIGNLTLTAYNSELSNRSFLEKRNMTGGFADSPIRLNRMLANLNHWNEETIVFRAKKLADVAVNIWFTPKLSAEKIKQFRKTQLSRNEREYTLDHYEYLEGELLELFFGVRKRILNMDASVKEILTKHYIAYKTTTNFVDIAPLKSRLRLYLNMEFTEIEDPKGICRDISDVGSWGNGDVEVSIAFKGDIDYVMTLIQQSFDKHWDGGNGHTY